MGSFLGTTQRKELESDRDYLTKQLKNPLVQDVPMVRRNLQRVEHDLETQAPPELKGQELDRVVRREKELREKIVPNMLSQAEMRRAPAGSVGREMAFQKRFKPEIIEWKNCRRTIERDSEDPDVANLERYRPVVSRGNLDNAQIPGKEFHFASPQYQANYDGIDWSTRTREPGEDVETFQSRIRRERLAEMRAQLAALEAEVKSDSGKEAGGEKAHPKLGLEEK
jgi:hypothetical protein